MPRAGCATVFPEAIGLAATWDTDLMFRVATAISDDVRAKLTIWGPRETEYIYQGLTLFGRRISTCSAIRDGTRPGEVRRGSISDGRMAVSFIKGMQGDDAKYLKAVATAKHYAVHSGPEPLRHTFDGCSDRALPLGYVPAAFRGRDPGRRRIVPTGNAEVFEMMEITHVPPNSSQCAFC